MKRIDPADLTVFLAIARHRSFRKAAVELGVTPSALSHSLRAIEERLDLRLVNRTTRSVALTEAGERLQARLLPAFRDIDDALEDLNTLRGKPSGRLRINASQVAVRLVLLPVLRRFLPAYPDIEVDLVADDAFADVVGEGFDAGVRLGESLSADMIATAIGPRQRFVAVAAPELLKQHRRPAMPQDLHELPCIRFRLASGMLYNWEFERGGIAQEVRVTGALTLNDMDAMIDAALAGLGVAYVIKAMVQPHLDAGRLEVLLGDWSPYDPGFFLYYPSRRQMPAALKAFVDFARGDAKAGKSG
ncbi:MAG: LysR family transcriptional regulator [Ferrovibrio sp.]|nr:LysR family transcriptional regulator [Ferrovibrio sp.]